MKIFKKECIHAQQLREHKRTYSEKEKEEGCWTCGGELTIQEWPKYHSIDDFNMGEEDKAAFLSKGPKCVKDIINHLNKSVYHCEACFRIAIERANLDFREGRTRNVRDLYEEMRSEAFRAQEYERLGNQIKDILECGKDCPRYPDLPLLRKCWESWR